MVEHIEADICVIGGGSGGLSVAAGASQMGAKTVLFEKGKMGGDCLNYGCVPSKALLAAGHAADAIRHAPAFGVSGGELKIDEAGVYGHVHGVIKAIEPHDSVERFESLGVTVIEDAARFTGPREVAGGGKAVRAKYFVVATGSSAMTPPIPGLDMIDYLTNETIFYRDSLPKRLLIVGGGVIGVEMGQAHNSLGSRVAIIDQAPLIGAEDPELVDVVRQRLIRDGVTLRENEKVLRVEKTEKGAAVITEKDGAEHRVEGTDVLVAVGRKPNVDGLDLEKAGVEYSKKGVDVDARLRTSNKRVFAIGDVNGGPQFTHVAGYQAGVVIRNALFKIPGKADYSAVPRVTYVNPELATIGLSEKRAREAGRRINVLRWSYGENDRAVAEAVNDGFIKVIVTPKGDILGAGIVGARAGDLLQPWILAMTKKLKIGDMARFIAPYPTLGEVSKRAAGSFYTPKLFSEKTQKLVRFLLKF